MKVGDRIFYQKDGDFYVDKIANIEIIDGKSIYEPDYRNWWCVTEDELLDESDEEVRNYMALVKDDMVKLSDVRDWLKSYAWDYYESDTWSSFHDEEMIRDLCKAMLYK